MSLSPKYSRHLNIDSVTKSARPAGPQSEFQLCLSYSVRESFIVTFFTLADRILYKNALLLKYKYVFQKWGTISRILLSRKHS